MKIFYWIYKELYTHKKRYFILFCFAGTARPHDIHAVEYQANVERRKLAEQSSNLAAAPANGGKPLGPVHPVASSRSSGSFRAVPSTEGAPPPPFTTPSRTPPEHHPPPNPGGHSNGAFKQPIASQSPPGGKSGSTWKYIGIGIGAFLVAIFVFLILICKSKAAQTIRPWKTGLSGQLQKAFITGSFDLILFNSWIHFSPVDIIRIFNAYNSFCFMSYV